MNSSFCLIKEIGLSDLVGMKEIRGNGEGIFRNEKSFKMIN